MSFSSTTARVQYTGDGTTVDFTVPFPFQADADLGVIVTTSGVDVTKVVNVDYVATGEGLAGGGNVRFTTAPASGTTVTIFRDLDLNQTRSFTYNGSFPTPTVTAAADKAMQAAQQLNEKLKRTFRLSEASAEIAPLTVADRAGKVPAFDNNGNPTLIAPEITAFPYGAPYSVSNIAALKAIPASVVPTGTQVSVAGYYTSGDGGGGLFYYASGSSATAVNGMVVAPDVGAGRWFRNYTGNPSIKYFGATFDGVTDDSAAWAAAASWSNSNKNTIAIPSGSSVYAGGDFTQDYVSFCGSGMPSVAADLSALLGGTIILGKWVFRGKNVFVRDLGCGMGSARGGSASDAFVASNASGEWAHVENVVGLGRAAADAFHGVLIEGYSRLTGGNVVGGRNQFGVAIKARSANFGNITGYDAGEAGVIIKHDKDYSGAGKCAFGNVVSLNTSATFGLLIYCYNTGSSTLEMRDVSAGNVIYGGVQYGVCLRADKVGAGVALMDSVTVGDISGTHTADGFLIQAVGGAQIFTVKHGDLIVTPSGSSAGVATYGAGFNVITGKVVASVPSGSSRENNAIYVDTGVYYFISSGVATSISYTANNAGISFNGTSAHIGGPNLFESYGSAPIIRTGLNSNGTPSSGRFVRGEFVRYNLPSIDGSSMSLIGWRRLTTGSGHVMGTDWAREYSSHVSPAI